MNDEFRCKPFAEQIECLYNKIEEVEQRLEKYIEVTNVMKGVLLSHSRIIQDDLEDYSDA